MLKHSKRRQAGDTLIEVLLAFAIFGAAAATLTRAMNGGLLEMFSHGQESQVQAQMRGQLAIIQKAHEEEIKTPTSDIWEGITNAITPADDSTAPVLANTQRIAPVNADGCTYSADKNRIFFVTDSGNAWTQPSVVAGATTDTAVRANGTTPQPNGTSLWIEAEYEPPRTTPQGVSRGYYDFYVKACWSDDIARQLKTVLRLYDPVAPTGEGTSMPSASSPPIPTPPPPLPINIAGSQYISGQCVGKLDTDREEAEGPPSEPLFSNGYPGNPYPCRSLGDVPQSNYTCTNYDVAYAVPASAEAGRYRMTLTYRDALCASGGGTNNTEILNVGAAYTYKLIVYRNGVQIGSMSLPVTSSEGAIEFPTLAPGDTIALRWWNNHFIGADNRDPDFVITNVKLEKM